MASMSRACADHNPERAASTCPQNWSPFVHPQQAVAMGTLKLAVARSAPRRYCRSRNGVLVRQQVTHPGVAVPLGEVTRVGAVLAGAVMLQADAAKTIGQGQQEFIMVVVTRAIELVGLLHQRGAS